MSNNVIIKENESFSLKLQLKSNSVIKGKNLKFWLKDKLTNMKFDLSDYTALFVDELRVYLPPDFKYTSSNYRYYLSLEDRVIEEGNLFIENVIMLKRRNRDNVENSFYKVFDKKELHICETSQESLDTNNQEQENVSSDLQDSQSNETALPLFWKSTNW